MTASLGSTFVHVKMDIRSVDNPTSISELNAFLDEYLPDAEAIGDIGRFAGNADGTIGTVFVYKTIGDAAAYIETDTNLVHTALIDFCSYPETAVVTAENQYVA